MFTPKAFKEENFATITAFIKEQPQATIVAQTASGLEACHIPMYWQDDGSEWGCRRTETTSNGKSGQDGHLDW